MANFTNLNLCYQITQTFGGLSARPLSSFSCSEVYIFNHTGNDAFIFTESGINTSLESPLLSTQSLLQSGLYFRLQTLGNVTIRGITNTSQVSAFIGAGGSGQLAYTPQFFSSFPLTVY